MLCECAAFYKRQGLTLKDVLDRIFEKYGYFIESLFSISLADAAGSARIAEIMQTLRDHPPQALANIRVSAMEDYETGIRTAGGQTSLLTLPKSDVLKFILEDGSWAAVRPSGTEPKCKFYFCSQGGNMAESASRLKEMMDYFKQF